MAATTTEGTGNGSVDNVKPKILNGVVRTSNIGPGTVIESDVADSAVTSSKLANNAVTNSKLASGSVTVSKMMIFKSTQQTGTGVSQNVAHGLGVVPGLVMVYPVDTNATTAGEYVMTEGSHTNTNVVVTVTSGKKFVVVAIA